MAEERRKDPVDGAAYTFAELSAYYATQKYSKKAIKAYWNDECLAVKSKAKAKAKVKAKAKAKVVQAKRLVLKYDTGKLSLDYRQKDNQRKREIKPRVKLEDMVPSGLCVVGEALIDFLPVSTADGKSAFRGVPGGSPFNCCIAARRLGLPVTFLGGLSNDLFGEELYGYLSREGVDMELIPRFGKPTTLAFVVKSKDEGEKYAFFKENAADRQLTKSIVAKSMRSRRFQAVHMSLGAVTLEDAALAEAFAVLYRMAAKQGALRSFDPNIRANMISAGGKAYSRRIEKLLSSVDLVKTSDADVEYMYGEGCDLATVAAQWLKLGPKVVVITKGSKGAEAFIPQQEGPPKSVSVVPPGERPNTIDAEGKSAPVADSVGAGDTFMGGLIDGFVGSESLFEKVVAKSPAWDEAAADLIKGVIHRAAVCAAITCSRYGCDPPTAVETKTALDAVGAGQAAV